MGENMKLGELAAKAVELAKKYGAAEAGAVASRSRKVGFDWRNGKVETVTESTSRGLYMRVYVDGRFSVSTTSDLRPEAMETFIKNCIAMTRQLEPDPFRSLPDPALYRNRSDEDLKQYDETVAGIPVETKLAKLKELEDAARSVEGADRIISVSTAWSDEVEESALVNSNGFSGVDRGTGVSISVETAIKGENDKRPEDWAMAAACSYADLAPASGVGSEATLRAVALLGSRKIKSNTLPVVVENRAAGRLVAALFGPLSGDALQQKRSCLEGKTGVKIGSDLLTITDDPFIKKAFGSRLYDSEGISAKVMPIFEKGVLKNYYIDTYYGKKLKLAPTTGGLSNLGWVPGTNDKASMIKALKEGVLITSFLGGNSNGTTGDFSLGIRGVYVKDGQLVHPVSEMNITGNILELWKNLVDVGKDFYIYSPLRTPSLMFEGVQLSGE